MAVGHKLLEVPFGDDSSITILLEYQNQTIFQNPSPVVVRASRPLEALGRSQRYPGTGGEKYMVQTIKKTEKKTEDCFKKNKTGGGNKPQKWLKLL